jgi:HAD superfamily hydrolase (TIGR01549 family)
MCWTYFLFDLDNSLFYIPDPSKYFDMILSNTINKLSEKKIPSREERNKFWLSGSDYVKLLRNWGIHDYEKFWEYFDSIDFTYRKEYIPEGKMKLYEDVELVLKKLNEKEDNRLAIVSNTAEYIVDFILDKFRINHFFDIVFALSSENEQEMAKPSPAGIHYVLKNMNFNNKDSDAIMVGDSIVDIFAAKRAGIDSCLLTRNLNKYPEGYDKWEYKPDYIITNLDELLLL